ncbi:MATE family efflux transporter [uncultured Clostridium sp.]|uniref:MATE family efflux transporter n=1 Tax=uncultured Clostridium sp. TaxID=59620 RepID=UPI0025D1FEE1|nr:MATE family efflux transporter [uncultured Clostridium sp.]
MTSYMTEMISDKKFIKKSIAIMIPVAAQAMLNTILNLVDTMMIGQLGQTEIAAVGLANKVFFVFTLLLFGIVSGSSILTAQYWGKKDIKNIHKVLGMSLAMALIGSIIFVLAGIFAPEGVMRIFTPSENTIAIGAAYLGIAAISYPMTAVTNCYISLLRGVNKVKAPVIISILSIGINIILNYTLIFGHFGAPELGVRGAAIATLIARIIECLCLLGYVYIDKNPAAARIKELFSFNRDFVKIYFKTVSPVIANEFMWGLGVTMYSLVYGRMGDEAVASITITQNVEQLCIVLFQGISAATAVILGNELGANKLHKAEKHATYFIVMQFALTMIMAVAFFFLRTPIIKLFVVTDATAMDIRKCLLVFIIYLPFRMFNLVNITGILRSGGDTTAALLLDLTGVWCVGIPLAFLGGISLGLPIYYVYAMVTFEEAYKFVIGFRRYRQKKWLKNLVDTEKQITA